MLSLWYTSASSIIRATRPAPRASARPLYASGTVIDWVKDPARKTGDVEVLEISTNYSVMYFMDRYLDESSSVDIRHILLRSDETNDAEIKQQAEELLQQWKDGEATEDSFADLARQHSADGNASSGGIYTGVNDSTNFVEPFKEWCLDESRRVGDTGIVKTDYGYHIMYFSASRPAWQSSAESALSNQDYSDYLDQLAEKYSSDISETIVNLVL
jgi:parvulin-like peptidyl-prolyl isomerase